MIGSATVSRPHVIFGFCLPIAILVGYILAEPAEVSSFVCLAVILGIVCIPMVIKWHHLLMLFSCNAAMAISFAPGRPSFWEMFGIISICLLMMNRSLGDPINFYKVNQISKSLIFLTIIVLGTAYANGVSFGSMGGAGAGGQRYVMLLAGIATYFCMSTLDVPFLRGAKVVGIYFLSSFTGLVGYIALLLGPSVATYIGILFPMGAINDEVEANVSDVTGTAFMRYGNLSTPAISIFCLMIARYGIKGLIDYRKPWRILVILISLLGCFYSGFRSNLVLIGLTFIFVFIFEGLIKTRYFILFILAGALGLGGLFIFSDRLPLPVQRAVCFVPGIKIDPFVQASADDSTQWRLNMWQQVVPTIPQYLIKGRGYGISQREMELMEEDMNYGGRTKSYEFYMVTGDYHNGPLSVIVPFGIFGSIGFLWFIYASIKTLYGYYRDGDARLKLFNTFLLSYFIAQLICFTFVFGSLFGQMVIFASLMGLGVALNTGISSVTVKKPSTGDFIKYRKVTI